MHKFNVYLQVVYFFAMFHCNEGQQSSNRWIPTWGNMPQLTESANLPSPPFNTTGRVFENSTIRQTIQTTIGGSQIRLQFSNAFGIYDLPITEVTVALSSNGNAGVHSIQTQTLKTVTFSDSSNFMEMCHCQKLFRYHYSNIFNFMLADLVVFILFLRH